MPETLPCGRKAVVGLSVFSCAVLGGIALYQTGILKHLPDPPIPNFDADAVNGSPDAYRLLETPDALLGMVSYAVTGCLAAMGPPDRSELRAGCPSQWARKRLSTPRKQPVSASSRQRSFTNTRSGRYS